MGRSLTGPGNIAKLGDTMLGAFNEAKAPDVPSKTTVNLVTTKGNLVDITGTTTIISMVLAPGAERVLRFTGSLRLTNSAYLVLPGGEDIITTPNDMAIVRGYPNGVVRFVTYSRASGYVQRVGDKMSGTLTFAAGTSYNPPIKYQPSLLTEQKIPHAIEWNGVSMYLTSGTALRRELLYTDGDGSKLTDFSSKQITDALGYTPFDPNSSPNRISPNGGILEAGQYFDMHYANSVNDYDARIEVSAPISGSGTSTLGITADQITINGDKVWTAGNLTNLNQLTNGPGYAPKVSPTFTGKVTFPQGTPASPSFTFSGSEITADTGLYSEADGVMGVACNGKSLARFTESGVNFAIDTQGTASISLDKDANSTLTGRMRMDLSGNKLRFIDSQTGVGTFLDISKGTTNAGSEIVTKTQMAGDQLAGYQKMPNGLIFQWGKRTSTGTIGFGWVSFPISFPNGVLNVQTTYEANDYKGDYRGAYGATLSGAYISTDNCNTWWFAIGY